MTHEKHVWSGAMDADDSYPPFPCLTDIEIEGITMNFGTGETGFVDYTDEELETLYRQEPLPPNQSFNLPANETEQPTEEETEPCTYPA
jgi:hypothetical protein